MLLVVVCNLALVHNGSISITYYHCSSIQTVCRRSGTGDTDIRKLRDRILDKAEETESTEDAKKIARDIGLLQKIEAIKYSNYKFKWYPSWGRLLGLTS